MAPLFIHFVDARNCQAKTIRLMEMKLVGVTVFCTQKPQNLKLFLPQPVYRIYNITGIYRPSKRESHICYDAQVFPNMINPTELNGGKYYEIVG